MDERMRELLLDGSSATTKAMRKALEEVGIKASPLEITDWVRSNLLREPVAVSARQPKNPVPSHGDPKARSTDERNEHVGDLHNEFEGAISRLFKGHEDLVPVLRALMERVNALASDTTWRAKSRYLTAADGADDTFLAVIRRGNQLVVGLTFPADVQHQRLRDTAGEFNWPRMTKLLILSAIEDVDDTALELIRDAIGNASTRSGGSKRFFGATLRQLLDAGLIAPGDRFVLMRGPQQIADATLTPSAHIEWGGRLFAVPSDHQFAQLMGRKSLNGWTHWHVERAGKLTPLSTLRDQMIRSS